MAGKRSRTGVLPLRSSTPWCCDGRKPLVQLDAPPFGPPRPSLNTTNAGNDSVSQPRPYDTQLPTDGKPLNSKPLLAKNNAGVWLAESVVIERMTVISSAISAMFGNMSDSQSPLWPRCLNAKSLRRNRPTCPKKMSGFSLEPSGLPWALSSPGL